MILFRERINQIRSLKYKRPQSDLFYWWTRRESNPQLVFAGRHFTIKLQAWSTGHHIIENKIPKRFSSLSAKTKPIV